MILQYAFNIVFSISSYVDALSGRRLDFTEK